MNQFEEALRQILKVALSLNGKSAIEIVLALVPLITGLNQFVNIVKGWEREVLIREVKTALDNIVGDETDALIGPSGQLVVLEVPYVGLEPLSDLVFSAIEAALLAQDSQ